MKLTRGPHAAALKGAQCADESMPNTGADPEPTYLH